MREIGKLELNNVLSFMRQNRMIKTGKLEYKMPVSWPVRMKESGKLYKY